MAGKVALPVIRVVVAIAVAGASVVTVAGWGAGSWVMVYGQDAQRNSSVMIAATPVSLQ